MKQKRILLPTIDDAKMFVAAAEESQNDLVQGRGDAYCGMLNDAKSILGVLSLDLRNVLTVQYDGENEAFEAFLEKMAVKRTAA